MCVRASLASLCWWRSGTRLVLFNLFVWLEITSFRQLLLGISEKTNVDWLMMMIRDWPLKARNEEKREKNKKKIGIYQCGTRPCRWMWTAVHTPTILSDASCERGMRELLLGRFFQYFFLLCLLTYSMKCLAIFFLFLNIRHCKKSSSWLKLDSRVIPVLSSRKCAVLNVISAILLKFSWEIFWQGLAPG